MIPIGFDVSPTITAFFHYGTGWFLHVQSAIVRIRETKSFNGKTIRNLAIGEGHCPTKCE